MKDRQINQTMCESSRDPDPELLARFELTKRIATRKGREFGISCQQYLLGIMTGQYPSITPAEYDAERAQQSNDRSTPEPEGEQHRADKPHLS